MTVGPFYDKTDGVTIETALTITNERITLTADTDDGSAPTNILDSVTGATAATANDLNYITGNDAGMMQLELSAANTNRVGRMFLSITDAANHVPVFHEFMVMPALVYDTFFAASGGATFPAATLASTTNITAGTITTVTNLTNAPTNGDLTATMKTSVTTAVPTVAGIADGVWDEDATAHQTTGTFGQAIGDPVADTNTIYAAVVTGAAGATVAADIIAVKADTAAILVDTGTTLDAALAVVDANVDSILVDTAEIGVAGAGLTAINLPDQTMNITGNITGNLSGSAGSVTGAVGSVTGAVGSVTGAVGSVTGLTNATIADAVWDEEITLGHDTADTAGAKLNDAGAAADPWATAIPGAYGAGTAGKIVGDNVNATVSSRATPAQVLTTALTESYAANGAAPTLAQAMFAVHQMLMQFAISGTSYTVRQLDNSTAAFVVTLDDATSPTSAVRT